MSVEKIRKLAEKYYKAVYWEKWIGSTMKAIVMTSYAAGYEQRRTEEP